MKDISDKAIRRENETSGVHEGNAGQKIIDILDLCVLEMGQNAYGRKRWKVSLSCIK